MAQAHAMAHPEHSDVGEVTSHPKPRLYIGIFFILLVFTIAEVAVTFEPLRSTLPQLPVLLVLALLKGTTIVMFYMHLKMDSRIFSAFFIVGLFLAISMLLTLVGLFTAHSREPFDQVAWRESLANGGGTVANTSGATTGATTPTK